MTGFLRVQIGVDVQGEASVGMLKIQSVVMRTLHGVHQMFLGVAGMSTVPRKNR